MFDFSVLMSIYNKENPDFFNKAMISIYDAQSIKPNEIILVQDGPLTEELDQCIDSWSDKFPDVLKIIKLSNNVGLGDALNCGLMHCSNELVARMDTDDIAHPERFRRQLEVFQNNKIDVCSSWVSEFEGAECNIVSYRKLPKDHHELNCFAKNKNPINHPAVMYKKSAVLAAGSYQKMMWFEDYYLWVRMLQNGAVFYNIQDTLVNMRAGYAQLERRRGFKYALSEFALQSELFSSGFINFFEFIKNITIRFVVRLSPRIVVKLIYKKMRASC